MRTCGCSTRIELPFSTSRPTARESPDDAGSTAAIQHSLARSQHFRIKLSCLCRIAPCPTPRSYLHLHRSPQKVSSKLPDSAGPPPPPQQHRSTQEQNRADTEHSPDARSPCIRIQPPHREEGATPSAGFSMATMMRAASMIFSQVLARLITYRPSARRFQM
jgi:hypothetical protein